MLFLKILAKIENILFRPWFNILATIYLNFRLCSFRDAIHFPLFVYGGIMIDSARGKFRFPHGCKRGMVTFGVIRGHFTAPKGKVFFCLHEKSEIIVTGTCSFSIDSSLRLTKGARLKLGKNVRIGDSVKIMAENYIEIGDNSEITFECQVMDTNFHYTMDRETKCIRPKNVPVILGKNNWVGNRTSVMKGCVTPDNCIVASNSLLNRNYGDEKYIVIAGSPAKIVKNNIERVYSGEKECFLDDYFFMNNVEFYREENV